MTYNGVVYDFYYCNGELIRRCATVVSRLPLNIGKREGTCIEIDVDAQKSRFVFIDTAWIGSGSNGCSVNRCWDPKTGNGFCTKASLKEMSFDELIKIVDTIHRGKDSCGEYKRIYPSPEGWRYPSPP